MKTGEYVKRYSVNLKIIGMKRIIVLSVFLMISLITVSQTEVSYKGTVLLKDSTLSKDFIFLKVNEWIVETFTNNGAWEKSEILLNDKENGTIQGVGHFKYYHKSVLYPDASGDITVTFKFWLKPGKYKYEFSNFIHASYYNDHWNMGLITDIVPKGEMGVNFKKFYAEVIELIRSEVDKFILTLDQEIYKKENTW